MAPSRLSLGLLIGCTAALAAVYACQDDGAVGPKRVIQADLEPVPPDSGAGLGAYTLPTPPTNNVGYVEANTGIPLPPGLIVRVTVHGTLTFIRNQDYVNCINQGHFNMGYLPGGLTSIGPGGDQGTYAVTVGKWYGSSTASGNLMKPAGVTSDSAYANIGVSASGYTVFAGRPTVWLLTCSTNGQNSYPGYSPVTGSQTVSATVLPPPAITVNRTTVVSGDTVTATLTASWTTSIDAYYAYWQWVADTGATGGGAGFVSGSGCGYGTLTCRVIVYGDGHLQVPNVNLDGIGLYQTAVSPTIHVAPAHLTLTVDSSHVASGSQVKFTAHRGDAKPVQVRSWVWTPGSTSPPGPNAVDCAGGDSLCVTVLQNTTPADSTGTAQAGTMMAVAYLGTAVESASVSVTVDRPLPGGGGTCGSAPMASGSVDRISKASRIPTASRTSARPGPAPHIGLSCDSGTPGISMSVTKDTLNPLYPRIRGETVNSVVLPEHPPDTAIVSVLLTQGGNPVPAGTWVTFRAEWLRAAGGHAHVTQDIKFELADTLTTGPEKGRPTVGYFCVAGCIIRQPVVSVQTSSNGSAFAYLVAGYLGGRARIVVTATVGGADLTATAIVGYAVPGLVSLKTRIPVSDVYWTGGTGDHPQGQNFYVQDSIAARLQPIAENMQKTINNQPFYLQYNDASLPSGGTFSVRPVRAMTFFEDPYRSVPGHTAHNTGLDQDIGYCYIPLNGDNGGVNALNSASCRGDTARTVNLVRLRTTACPTGATQPHGYIDTTVTPHVFVATHNHIRFVGSTDHAPGC